jgi:TonB family protein
VLEGRHRTKPNGGSGAQRQQAGIVGAAGPAPRFALLPQPKSRWREFACSLLTQAAGLLLLSLVSVFAPKALPVREYQEIALLAPPSFTLHPDPAPVAPPAVKPPRPKLEVSERLVHLRPPRLITPPPVVVPETEVKTAFQPMHIMETPRPPKPLPEVRTGVLAANAPLPELKQPAAKVQTGGFGNPLGQDGEARPGRLTVSRIGSFDLPSGPGLGNGTGGAKGAVGIVASAGFGKATSVVQTAALSAGGSGVRTGGFGDARLAPETARKIEGPAKPPTVPVVILSKPAPAYTEEARRLRKEGEVLLEVVFTASGEVQVLRVLQGLGYGLDEAAVAAAKQVRFRPAQRDGRPVDSNAKLHVVFQLAY